MRSSAPSSSPATMRVPSAGIPASARPGEARVVLGSGAPSEPWPQASCGKHHVPRIALGEPASSSSERSASSLGALGEISLASTHTPWWWRSASARRCARATSSPLGTQLAGWLCTHTGGPVAAAARLNSISGSLSELASSQATGAASPAAGGAGRRSPAPSVRSRRRCSCRPLYRCRSARASTACRRSAAARSVRRSCRARPARRCARSRCAVGSSIAVKTGVPLAGIERFVGVRARRPVRSLGLGTGAAANAPRAPVAS